MRDLWFFFIVLLPAATFSLGMKIGLSLRLREQESLRHKEELLERKIVELGEAIETVLSIPDAENTYNHITRYMDVMRYDQQMVESIVRQLRRMDEPRESALYRTCSFNKADAFLVLWARGAFEKFRLSFQSIAIGFGAFLSGFILMLWYLILGIFVTPFQALLECWVREQSIRLFEKDFKREFVEAVERER